MTIRLPSRFSKTRLNVKTVVTWWATHGRVPLQSYQKTSIAAFQCCRTPISRELKGGNEIIQQQLRSGVIEVAPEAPDGPNEHYLSHHLVAKEDSATSKTRMVFNASKKELPENNSLNDCLYPSANKMPDMAGILLPSRRL